MLTRRLVAAPAALALLLGAAPVALADGDGSGDGSVGVGCAPMAQDCEAHAKQFGSSGGEAPAKSTQPKPVGKSGKKASKQKCMIGEQEVPCDRPDYGHFNQADMCYWAPMDPQPPANDPLWQEAGAPAGWKPGDGGKLYERACFGQLESGVRFAATDPTGAAVDPAVLAREAVSKMTLRGAKIGITPKPGGKGVVGMPVYMWTAKDAEHWGPNTASASAGAVTVTATAKVKKIVWKMGDGKSVTCTTAGTPYKSSYGKEPSPDCGYRYTQPSSSQPGGKYHVTATSTWSIDWAGAGQNGQLTEIRNASVDIAVGEVQVLN
ncbi:ATP/GTP-binding protein [Streptomyces sp. NPDC050315]|uniref:ATP/GTP-binding protein n=1 Tax=Streptomyces sp. NPDC050315 TaxID=3155039 RepID=UPI0034146143